MRELAFLAVLVAAIFTLKASGSCAEETKRYTFEHFINVKWVKDPQLSPNGKKILFTLEQRDLKENKTKSSLWTVDVANSELKKMTDENGRALEGRWSPDGKYIAFTSIAEGDSQIWLMTSSGTKQQKITDLANGANGPSWSPNSKQLLFISSVYGGCKTEEENKKKKNELEKSKVKARLIEDLPYLVFDHWRDNKYSHLFVMNISDCKPVDLTPGNFDVPPIDLGGKTDYAFSPDGKEVCFVTNKDKNLAWSTNNDLFTVNLEDKSTKQITTNQANDCGVVYSPDGKYIAYTAMERPGFEADRRVIHLYDRKEGKNTAVSQSLDRSVSEFAWTPDSKSIIFTAEDEGYSSVYDLNIENGAIKQLTRKTFNDSINVSKSGTSVYIRRQSMIRPPELMEINRGDDGVKGLTNINANFANIEMQKPEEFWFTASDGQKVQGFILKPHGFSKDKKYPLVYLIHGGPQGAWSDDFHQRWNTELFAAQGYAVAAVNFRGSNGYGQRFTDGVSKNWGGRPYEDLMEGIDFIIENYSFVNENKMAAVGASYGGYMVNWIMGHTNRFKCAVCLSGVFNTVSEYGTTEELWFPEWEFGGTPYKNRELYEKWNPVNFVNNFQTPCLVIHGEEDYRVPVSEGKQLFTALRRNNVPAQFLYFPDECHFIRKPQNMQLWYKTMNNWFAKWFK